MWNGGCGSPLTVFGLKKSKFRPPGRERQPECDHGEYLAETAEQHRTVIEAEMVGRDRKEARIGRNVWW